MDILGKKSLFCFSLCIVWPWFASLTFAAWEFGLEQTAHMHKVNSGQLHWTVCDEELGRKTDQEVCLLGEKPGVLHLDVSTCCFKAKPPNQTKTFNSLALVQNAYSDWELCFDGIGRMSFFVRKQIFLM